MYGAVSHQGYPAGQPSWFQGSEPAYRQDSRWQPQQQQQQAHGWQQQPQQAGFLAQQQQPHSQRYQQQKQQPYQQQYHQQQHKQAEQQQQPQQPYQQPGRRVSGSQIPGPSGSVATSTPNNRPLKRAKAGQQHQQPHSQQAAQQQHQQPRRQAADTVPSWLNTLSDDILQFTQQALPSPQEDQQRQAVLSSFEGVVNAVISRKGVNVMLFGSARAGLALHSSDLDVMITGLCAPNGATGGYDRDGKQLVARYLRQVLSEASRRMAVRSSKIIAHARIPVLKLELRNGIELDVSINDASGVSAANFLQSWQQDFSALRPLVIVLKSILKQNSLGEVAFGGLGSWSLANMAIAHLMAEDAAGGPVDHPGAMLFSFLRRYGMDWNLNKDAVAVAQGGVVSRNSLATMAGPFAGQDKLAVKDPLTGREVAGGSHRYADVQRLWRELFTDMRERGLSAAARSGGQYRVLSVILDCNAVLQRAGAQPSGGHSSRGRDTSVGYRSRESYDNSSRGYNHPYAGGAHGSSSRKRDR